MGNEYIAARKEYVERVKKELLGPGSEVSIPDEEHELISSSPSVRYSIGILFPQKQCMVRENEDTTDDEKITENEDIATDNADRTTKNATERADSAIDPDEDSLDEQIGLAMQNLPSSMGYSFLAKGNCDRLVFSLAFATYDNAKMEDCAFPIPVELPDGYTLPPEVSYCLKYDASHNCLRLIYKISKKDINDLRELDSMPENERGWIINGLYRLFDQFHSGFVRCPHTATISIDFDGKNYCDCDFVVDEHPVKITALRRLIKDDVYSVTVMLVNPLGKAGNNANPKECYFQAKLRINNRENAFVFADTTAYSQYGYDDPEEKSNRLLYRKKQVYGYGLGTSTAWEIDAEGNGWLENDFFPQAEVPAMNFDLDKEKSKVPPYTLSMKQLSDLGEHEKSEVIEGLRTFVRAFLLLWYI